MKKLFNLVSSIIVISIFLCSCGRYKEYNLKPDDELSRAVRDAMGKDFYYLGKEDASFGGLWYEYQIKKKESEAIVEFVDSINKSLYNEQEKIEILVFSNIPGGLEQIFRLNNFSDSKLEKADFEGVNSLYIREPKHVPKQEQIFYDPSTYIGIKGIRKLYIDAKMQEKAEEQGIDWYECWPELEEIVVME